MPHQTRDTMATHTYIAAGARAGVPYDTAVFTRLLSLSQRLPPVAYVGMGIFELCPLTASYKSTHIWGRQTKNKCENPKDHFGFRAKGFRSARPRTLADPPLTSAYACRLYSALLASS